MKTAISVPDPLFRSAEKLARRLRKTRSWVYGEALRQYLLRHEPDEVTQAMNKALDAVGSQVDPWVAVVARKALVRSQW